MDILTIVLAIIVVALIFIIVWALGKEKQARLALSAANIKLMQVVDVLGRKSEKLVQAEEAVEALRPDALLGRQAREQRAAASRKAVEKAAERREAKAAATPAPTPTTKPKPTSRKRKLAK